MTDDLIKELRSYPAHYVAAHRAADALEKAERNMHAREYHNVYLEDQLLKLEQAAEALRDYISKQQLDIITLGQEVGRLREALERLIAACDRGRVVTKPGCGIGGMTIDANLRASNINGVSASAVEDARAALGEEKKR